MVNCSQIQINRELYEYLQGFADPCSSNVIKESNGQVSFNLSIPGLRDHYTLEKRAINDTSVREKLLLRKISNDMLAGTAPLLFPFLYCDYVCNNTMYMILQPAQQAFKDIVEKNTVEWWAQLLYQIAKAVYYLEDNKINHGRLTTDAVMIQHYSTDYNNLAIMIVDFNRAVQGSKFVLGRDLNYFLKSLFHTSSLPQKLQNELQPFVGNKPDWQTSGKHISRWLAKFYPIVTDRCSLQRMNKIYGAGIGAIVGDALGMPIEFDYKTKKIITEMHGSGKFHGLLAGANVPAGTFTDDSQMALALIDAIMTKGRRLVPGAVAKEFKRWVDSDPLDVGVHTKTVFKLMKPDASNWYAIVKTLHEDQPDSRANGATMRAWPIAILHHHDSIAAVIADTVKQAMTSHMNSDAVYAAVFVTCLIHQLINETGDLDQAINTCLAIVEPHITEELYGAISSSHTRKYSNLDGGSGFIVDTMSVVMWAIKNTKTFKDAVVKAANVRGDTDTNASITGAIAGALYGFDNIPSTWLAALDAPNKHNTWRGQAINVEQLKDRLASLAQC